MKKININHKKLKLSLMGLGIAGLVLTPTIITACKKDDVIKKKPIDDSSKNSNEDNVSTKPNEKVDNETPKENVDKKTPKDDHQPNIPSGEVNSMDQTNSEDSTNSLENDTKPNEEDGSVATSESNSSSNNVDNTLSNEERERVESERFKELYDRTKIKVDLLFNLVKPKYTTKLESLKDDKSNKEKLISLAEDVQYFFEKQTNKEITRNDWLKVNLDNVIVEDINAVVDYKTIYDEINNQPLETLNASELYEKSLQLVDVITHFKTNRDVYNNIKKLVNLHLDNNNIDESLKEEFKTFSFNEKSLEQIDNFLKKYFVMYIKELGIGNLESSNSDYIKLSSYLEKVGYDLSRNTTNVPYFNNPEFYVNPVDNRTSIANIFNQPRHLRVSETNYNQRYQFFKTQLDRIIAFNKNIKDDAWIKWINSTDHTTITSNDYTIHPNKFLTKDMVNRILGDFNVNTTRMDGFWSHILYEFINNQSVNFTNEQDRIHHENTKQFREKILKTSQLLYKLMYQYGFDYFPGNKETLWGFDDFIDQNDETEENQTRLLNEVNVDMVDQPTGTLASPTLFKKPLMFWKTIKKVGGFDETTNTLIDNFITKQNEFATFYENEFQGTEFRNLWSSLKNGSKDWRTFINEFQSPIYDKYITLLEDLNGLYKQLSNNENTKYLLFYPRVYTQESLQSISFFNQFDMFNTRIIASNPNATLKSELGIDVLINQSQNINDAIFNQTLSFNQRKERIINLNKIMHLLRELQNRSSFKNFVEWLNNNGANISRLSSNQEFMSQKTSIINNIKEQIRTFESVDLINDNFEQLLNLFENTLNSPNGSSAIISSTNEFDFFKNKDVMFDLGKELNEPYSHTFMPPKHTYQGRASLILLGFLDQVRHLYIGHELESQSQLMDELYEEYFKPYTSLDKQGWLNKKDQIFMKLKERIVNHDLSAYKIIDWMQNEFEWIYDNIINEPLFSTSNRLEPIENEQLKKYHDAFIKWFKGTSAFDQTSSFEESTGSSSSYAEFGIIPFSKFTQTKSNDESLINSFKDHWNSLKQKLIEIKTPIYQKLGVDMNNHNLLEQYNNLVKSVIDIKRLYDTNSYDSLDNEDKENKKFMKNMIDQTLFTRNGKNEVIVNEPVFIDPMLSQPSERMFIQKQDWGLFEILQSTINLRVIEQMIIKDWKNKMIDEELEFEIINPDGLIARVESYKKFRNDTTFINALETLLSEINKIKEEIIMMDVVHDYQRLEMIKKVHEFEQNYMLSRPLNYAINGTLDQEFVNEFESLETQLRSKQKTQEIINLLEEISYMRMSHFKTKEEMIKLKDRMKTALNN